MSKLAVVIAVPALAAAMGLAVLSIDLADQVDRLEDRIEEMETGAAKNPDRATPRSAERAVPSRRDDARVRALEERLGALEAGGLAAAAPAAEPVPLEFAADTPPPGDPAFRHAVEAVLDARDAARRAERMERAASGRTRQILRGLEVTETQEADVLRVVTDGLRRQEESRDLELDPELARERRDELRAELERALEGILAPEQMEQVRKRAGRRPENGRRGGERRRGGDDGERGGRRAKGRADDA